MTLEVNEKEMDNGSGSDRGEKSRVKTEVREGSWKRKEGPGRNTMNKSNRRKKESKQRSIEERRIGDLECKINRKINTTFKTTYYQ